MKHEIQHQIWHGKKYASWSSLIHMASPEAVKNGQRLGQYVFNELSAFGQEGMPDVWSDLFYTESTSPYHIFRILMTVFRLDHDYLVPKYDTETRFEYVEHI